MWVPKQPFVYLTLRYLLLLQLHKHNVKTRRSNRVFLLVATLAVFDLLKLFCEFQVVTKPEFNFLNDPMYKNISIIIWDPANYSSPLDEWYRQPDFPVFQVYKK